MNFKRSAALALGCLGLAAQAFAQSDSSVVLPVLVYNYANVPNATLHGALRRAARVFHATGVTFAWHHCRVSTKQPQKGPYCSHGISRTDLVLKIHPRSQEQASGAGKDVGGFVPAGDMVSDAYVFYDRLHDMARQDSADVTALLGSIIAHELGHLLTAGSHSSNGMMRAEWTVRSLAQASLRKMEFTPEQVQRIHSGALSRVRHHGEISPFASFQNQE